MIWFAQHSPTTEEIHADALPLSSHDLEDGFQHGDKRVLDGWPLVSQAFGKVLCHGLGVVIPVWPSWFCLEVDRDPILLGRGFLVRADGMAQGGLRGLAEDSPSPSAS